MVEDSKKTMYWIVCLVVLFAVFIVVTFFVSGGFEALGTRVLRPIIDAIFGEGSLANLVVQGVLSVVVIIVLVVCLWYGRKQEWF
jgi:Zn-dependent protease with chaperone function